MANGGTFIVRRAVVDNGPNGGGERYIEVAQPHPGETIYHGQFAPYTENCGQFDRETVTYWRPVGEVTTSNYQGGTKAF